MVEPPSGGVDRKSAEIVVIGSGPGGSTAACLLAEAGHDVLVLEEGPYLEPGVVRPFSREEMVRQYRNGGLTVAMGPTKVAYVEGRCAGGGSEINSGLYHRTPPGVLAEWREQFRVDGLCEEDLRPHFEANERELSVSKMPGSAPCASLKLQEGATSLGWQWREAARWFAYEPTTLEPNRGVKQTMTRTFLPRALAAGATLLSDVRALRLRRHGEHWEVAAEQNGADGPRSLTVDASRVVVACGAIQTPALLQRSGLAPRAGDTLHFHPTVKVVARFPDVVNSAGMGVPVHQVNEYSPEISLGCSISSRPYLRLAMIDHPHHAHLVASDWQHMAIYYAMTRGGRGTVRSLPGFRDPLVRCRLTAADRKTLADGLKHVARCLFAAGALALYPSITGHAPLTTARDLDELCTSVPAKRTKLMTVHLFSSCPMGEDRTRCVTDSFGRIPGVPGVSIADASLLPGPPGVNPQGSIMAIVRRNTLEAMLAKSRPRARVVVSSGGSIC
jgi:choline dehydrogenase-like flavoprotein